MHRRADLIELSRSGPAVLETMQVYVYAGSMQSFYLEKNIDHPAVIRRTGNIEGYDMQVLCGQAGRIAANFGFIPEL
ncbi:MAG: hypothetical protein FD123_3068 [Bacteroidetes bacterium]|nr:MAG: hypothetical protein FD123_3068 [Bacteroidota bacterium]